MNNLFEKYAKLLIHYSLNIKKGEIIAINSTYLAEPLLQEVYREITKSGAYALFLMNFKEQSKIFYDNASEEQLKFVSPFRKYLTENIDAMLSIRAPFNLKETQSVDTSKKRIQSESSAEIQKTFMQRAAQGKLKWTLCQYPTDASAQESNMSTSQYWEFIANACHLFEDDPVKKWNEIHNEQQRIIDFLSKRETMTFKGKDIDITFSYKDRLWINSDGHHNMPSGEIFTTPVEDSINGKVRFSYPGIFMGKEIEDITLEIKNGEVVSWDAVKGKDLLDEIFKIQGARHFGEAAIGTNYGVKEFTKNMLFDEKIGGTIHMAIGAAYPETGGKNQCAIHWDLLANMKNSGEIYADNELIYKNGKFII